MCEPPDNHVPCCWLCGSHAVIVTYNRHRRVHCARGCVEVHTHHRDIPTHRLHCRTCGNDWIDGSGDYATLAKT